MSNTSPVPLTASAPAVEQPSLLATGFSAGAAAPFLSFSMGRSIAVRSFLPFVVSVVLVIAGLSLGISHGVDWVASLIDSGLASLFDPGWLRSLLVAVIAWPVGLIGSVAVGYQVGFLVSLPLLDRLALEVEKREEWQVDQPGLGLATSALCVSTIMVFWVVGSLFCTLFGLLPVVGILFVLLGWLWSALCIALDALDPTLTRAGYGLQQRLALIRRYAVPVVTFGALASLWIVVPGSYPGIVVGGSRLAARILKREATDQALE